MQKVFIDNNQARVAQSMNQTIHTGKIHRSKLSDMRSFETETVSGREGGSARRTLVASRIDTMRLSLLEVAFDSFDWLKLNMYVRYVVLKELALDAKMRLLDAGTSFRQVKPLRK
jgi:hypothetical protein